MRNLPRFPLALLAVALLGLTAAGCKPGDKTATVDKAAGADKAATAEKSAKYPGLPTEKDQVSYMIGMAMGKQLETAKDDVDIDVMAKAIKSTLAGEKLLITEDQAREIGQAFGQKMQAKQMEKMLADAKKNTEEGQAFLAANGKKPGVQTTESGLQYQVITAGTGPKPTASDIVRINYKGTLIDGTVFDDSSKHDGPAEFPLSQVVPGWKEGVMLMPVGSKYKFWIPAELGYGAQGTPGGPIPPNAALIFEVELLGIGEAPAK